MLGEKPNNSEEGDNRWVEDIWIDISERSIPKFQYEDGSRMAIEYNLEKNNSIISLNIIDCQQYVLSE